jgi:CheY-like chemotaxis protein
MTASAGWRVLLVEDQEVVARQISEDAEAGSLLRDVGKMYVDVCREIKNAPSWLEDRRADFVVLDLKDDATGDEEAGLRVFDEIKKRRFVPVVFYSAVANLARGLDNPFVRVVEKTEALPGLRQAFKQLYDTGLPAMLRHIEGEQRSYMWGFVHEHRAELTGMPKEELVLLMARRLAYNLSSASVRQFLVDHSLMQKDLESTALPMEHYIYPPSGVLRAGTICKLEKGGTGSYSVVLSPTCQLLRSKVDHVLLARCSPLEKEGCFDDLKAKGQAASNSAKKKLQQLLTNRYADRYAFLPGTFFLPDLIVDFQSLETVEFAGFKDSGYVVVAELDSPFAEALLLRCTDYYGRVATPDLNIAAVLTRGGIDQNALDGVS